MEAPTTSGRSADEASVSRAGLSLAVITRLGNASLRKLCRHARTLSRGPGHTGFSQRKRRLAEHEALESLWARFEVQGAEHADLALVLRPLFDEWCTTEDPERRGLLLRLVSTFFEADHDNLSRCLSDSLAGASQGARYAALAVLLSLVRESSKSTRTTRDKSLRLRALSSALPALLRVCAGSWDPEPAPRVPTRLTSMAADCALLVVVEMLSLETSAQDPSHSEVFLSSASWLWEKIPALAELLERHEGWCAALSAEGAAIADSTILLQCLRAMRKRVAKMDSFDFSTAKDEDHAKTIHARCWLSWAPLLLFDLKLYRTIQDKDKHGWRGMEALKRATSALRHAGREDQNRLLSIQEAIFRELVATGLVVGLGRHHPMTDSGREFLEGLLDAMVPITGSASLGTPLCDLASNIAVRAIGEIEADGEGGEERPSARVRAFVGSVLRSSADGTEVTAALLQGLLNDETGAAVVMPELEALLRGKGEGRSPRLGLAALDLVFRRGAGDGAGSGLNSQIGPITDLVVGLNPAGVREQVRDLLQKLPSNHVIRSLLRKIGDPEQDLRPSVELLLEFLKKIREDEAAAVDSAFREFVRRMSGSPTRVAQLMKMLGEEDKESFFWGAILPALLQASAAEPSNQTLIQTMSALSPQLSAHSAIIGDFVISSLAKQEALECSDLAVFDRLHPFLVLRIVSKVCFDRVVTEGLETRLSAEGHVLVSNDVLGFLIERMRNPDEDLQVRKVCSELCGKMNPNVSFSVLLAIFRESIGSRQHAVSRACMYAFCSSFANHRGSAPMVMHSRSDTLSKEVVRLFKAISLQADDESKKTQLGCLDCFGSVLLLKLESGDLSIDPMAFRFEEVAPVLIGEDGAEETRLAAILGLGKSLDLQTHTFLANALITTCPRIKETRREALFACQLIPGILKHMVFRSPETYADHDCLYLDEILLQVLFISSYHLPGPVLADYASDIISLVVSVMGKGLPARVQSAAARIAACLLSKEDLVLGCKDVLADLGRVLSRVQGEASCSGEILAVCQALLSRLQA